MRWPRKWSFGSEPAALSGPISKAPGFAGGYLPSGNLYDEDIHELRFELKKRKQAAVQKAFPSAGLPENKSFANKADEVVRDYFSIYLSQTEEVQGV